MPKQELVYYYSKGCPYCSTVTPLLDKLTRDNQVSMEKREVEKCGPDDKFCPTVKYVPTVAQCTPNGHCKEVPLNKVSDVIKKMGRKKK